MSSYFCRPSAEYLLIASAPKMSDFYDPFLLSLSAAIIRGLLKFNIGSMVVFSWLRSKCRTAHGEPGMYWDSLNSSYILKEGYKRLLKVKALTCVHVDVFFTTPCECIDYKRSVWVNTETHRQAYPPVWFWGHAEYSPVQCFTVVDVLFVKLWAWNWNPWKNAYLQIRGLKEAYSRTNSAK